MQRTKTLKVVRLPQCNDYVPWVRVAGNWLKDAGFNYGDRVLLIATDGEIIIRKAENELPQQNSLGTANQRLNPFPAAAFFLG